jgi:hypothetical protein
MVRVISTRLTKMDKDPDERPPILDQTTTRSHIQRPYSQWGSWAVVLVDKTATGTPERHRLRTVLYQPRCRQEIN